jgi:transcriptional regulator with XRE-family HTH domain
MDYNKKLDLSCKMLQLVLMEQVQELSKNACVIFGGFVKDIRLQNKIIARDAAQNAGMLPSNFSKLEHGALKPSADSARQKMLATAIGLELGTAAADRFFDLAADANEAVPADIADIISEDDAWPLLLRTAGNKRLTEEDIKQLIEIVRGLAGANQKS